MKGGLFYMAQDIDLNAMSDEERQAYVKTYEYAINNLKIELTQEETDLYNDIMREVSQEQYLRDIAYDSNAKYDGKEFNWVTISTAEGRVAQMTNCRFNN